MPTTKRGTLRLFSPESHFSAVHLVVSSQHCPAEQSVSLLHRAPTQLREHFLLYIPQQYSPVAQSSSFPHDNPIQELKHEPVLVKRQQDATIGENIAERTYKTQNHVDSFTRNIVRRSKITDLSKYTIDINLSCHTIKFQNIENYKNAVLFLSRAL